MSLKGVLPNFNVLYFFILLFTFCESYLVNQPNEGYLESTDPNISGVEILEGNIIDKRFIDEESSKIVSIITKEMIPQLFERFQHPKLTFTKETWTPKNCEMDKYWSIQLIFDKRRDVEPPDTATLTMMLDDVFRIYKNISRVEYNFSKAIFERESVKIMICFQNVPENSEDGKPSKGGANDSEYKSSTSPPAEKYNTTSEQEYVEKLIKDEMLPIFQTFSPGYTISSKITHKAKEVALYCPMEIFDVSFVIDIANLNHKLINFLEKWLQKLPEMYYHIMVACLTQCFRSTGFEYMSFARYQIRLKVSKPDDNCRALKGGMKLTCK